MRPELIKWLRRAASVGYAVALPMFLLPFFTFSCGGRETTAAGYEIAFPSLLADEDSQLYEQDAGREAGRAAALASTALAGAFLALFMAARRKAIWSALAGLAGWSGLLGLRLYLLRHSDGDAALLSVGLANIETEPGYWLAFGCLTAAVLCGAAWALFGGKKAAD